jgi:hypothetical protein
MLAACTTTRRQLDMSMSAHTGVQHVQRDMILSGLLMASDITAAVHLLSTCAGWMQQESSQP